MVSIRVRWERVPGGCARKGNALCRIPVEPPDEVSGHDREQSEFPEKGIGHC